MHACIPANVSWKEWRKASTTCSAIAAIMKQTVQTLSGYFFGSPIHSYLIFDLHRTVLYCVLKETLGSSCWQQKRKLAVLALTETAHRPCITHKYCCKHKQPSSASRFPPKCIHGENIIGETQGYLSWAISLASPLPQQNFTMPGLGGSPQ